MTTEESIIQEIRERARRGLSKYGVSVDDNALSQMQWLQHAIEELCDAAVYLRRLQREMMRDECRTCPRCGQPGKVITTTSGPACSRCVEE